MLIPQTPPEVARPLGVPNISHLQAHGILKDFGRLQGGPPSSYKWGYNSSYPFIRPFIGAITLFITSRGPPCRGIEDAKNFELKGAAS